MIKKLLIVGMAVSLSGCTVKLPFGAPIATVKEDGTQNVFNQKIQAGSLWKSADGGKNFEVKSRIDDKTSITKADILSITYHPKTPGTMYVGSVENGIFKTTDAGNQWTPINFPPKRIYSFILDRQDPDNRMFASGVVGEWGKIFRSENGGDQWDPVYTEPGSGVTVTALSQHPISIDTIFAGTSTGTVVKSVDGGNTWKNVGNKIDGIVSDIAFDAQKKSVVYLVTFGQKIFYSPDDGVNWLDWEEEKRKEVADLQKRSSDAATSGNTEQAKIFRERAQQLSERNQKDKMPSGIVSVVTDPVRSGVLYVGTNAGFFRSPDYGKYWYEINIIESAKKFPIRSIAINPKDSKEIVFVAGKAFYKSINEGETWFVTGLNADRGASFVSYDPFDSKYLFVGLRNFK